MILDTNGLSALADGHPGVKPLLTGTSVLSLPVIALGEFRYGIRYSRHRSMYEQWLDEFVENARVLTVDEQTAVEYATVREDLKQAGRPIPSNDLWIAALARQHSLPVLSRDGHFDFVPKLKRISW